MSQIIRDSTVGQLVNWASKGKLLPYADQRSDYSIPSRYLLPTAPSSASSFDSTKSASLTRTPSSTDQTLVNEAAICKDLTKDVEAGSLDVTEKEIHALAAVSYPFLVTFDGPDDPDRPMAWTLKRRAFVAALIMLMTTSIYIGSAVYTSSIPGIEARFGASPVVATLGLSLFVGGYGVGPMLLGPLADVVAIGRTPIYVGGLFLYVIFQLPVIYAPNIATLLVFRFLAGFVGSPALSVAGTTMTEIFHQSAWAYAIGAWAIAAVLGPILGPVVGGFAAQANGWQWPMLELLWLAAFALVVLVLFLPETSEKTILYKRAQRLRKLTGNAQLKSQSELDAGENNSIVANVGQNLVTSLKISADPAIIFANTYIGLVYGIFYLWFEMFPVVFNEFHGFNLGVSGLPYLGFVVTAALTFTVYALYNRIHIARRMATDPNFGPQTRLEIGLVAGFFIPVSLLIFGWGAHAHWIVSIIGAALYLPGIYLLFQSILMFISMYVKPQYNSAVMASNTLFRSTLAAAFPLFGRYFVDALGVGPACSLLAGVSLLMIPILYLLYRKVPTLRMTSKWANDAEKVDPNVAGH